MDGYRVRRAKPIAAEIRVPGDLALSQRAVLIAALANGPSILTGFLPAEECLLTIQACRALGVKFDYLSARDSELPWSPEPGGPAGPSRLRVHGTAGKLRAPTAALDCGSCGSVPVLLSGLLAGQPWNSKLLTSGSSSLAELHALAVPLQDMGARVEPAAQEKSIVINVHGSDSLKGIAAGYPVPTALARDALLLAGLRAQGKTTLTDVASVPDHLERLLRHWQVKTARTGLNVSIWGGQMPESCDFHIPGDLSCAAPFIVTAAAQPGSLLTIHGVGLNVHRAAFLRVLIRMGAQVAEEITETRGGEPFGTLIVRGAPLQCTVIPATEAEALHESLPILAVAAALASGGTVIEHTPATAVSLGRMAHLLQLMGVKVAGLRDGIEIQGTAGKPLLPGALPSGGDPHVAMACAAAGFFTDGETIVEDVTCVESRWWGFGERLQLFQSREISGGMLTTTLHVVPKRKLTSRGDAGTGGAKSQRLNS